MPVRRPDQTRPALPVEHPDNRGNPLPFRSLAASRRFAMLAAPLRVFWFSLLGMLAILGLLHVVSP